MKLSFTCFSVNFIVVVRPLVLNGVVLTNLESWWTRIDADCDERERGLDGEADEELADNLFIGLKQLITWFLGTTNNLFFIELFATGTRNCVCPSTDLMARAGLFTVWLLMATVCLLVWYLGTIRVGLDMDPKL